MADLADHPVVEKILVVVAAGFLGWVGLSVVDGRADLARSEVRVETLENVSEQLMQDRSLLHQIATDTALTRRDVEFLRERVDRLEDTNGSSQ